jgi:hypothetical protein
MHVLLRRARLQVRPQARPVARLGAELDGKSAQDSVGTGRARRPRLRAAGSRRLQLPWQIVG